MRYPSNPRTLRRLLNLWPPFAGAGISVTHIADDWRRVDVALKERFYNRNYVGTHFGGSLLSMTDPWYMLMLMNNLGKEYVVWDKTSTIEYLRPGRGTVGATFTLEADVLDEVRAAASDGERVLRPFRTRIVDEGGKPVAALDKIVYVRRTLRP